MTEIRYIEVYDNQGNLIAREPYVVSDEQLELERLTRFYNEHHRQAVAAYNNWDRLTLAQKDTVLKELLGWLLWKEGYR